ncbi:MAG: glycosyltransferase family 2 protein [Sedimentisphaerales bacterium]|nr:glycosyltransferase family 2 protein [Sedimentisphaerales bacterium]
MKDVSIIIVAWNVRDLLYDCLDSIYKQTKGIEYEIIYVDNASKDGSVEMVKEHFPETIIIQNTDNKGFVLANNQGLEIAKGRYALLLNSDTVVLDNAIAKTIEFADTHPEAAVVGCRTLNPDKTLQPTCFMFPSILNLLLSSTYLYKIFPKSRFFGREFMTWWDRNDVREVSSVTGCYMLVRKEAIEQVGFLDERYFIYAEETDWCYRFRKNGWKVLFTPAAEIIHYGGQTTRQMSKEFKLQLYGSILIFMKLHRSKFTFPFARFIVSLFFFIRVPYWLVKALLDKNDSKNSIDTAKTYLAGSFYCLTNWKKLLMNKEVVKDKLYKHETTQVKGSVGKAR